MKTEYQAFLDEPLPTHFRAWDGKMQPAKYPAGTLIARCGDVFWFETGRETFAIVYRLHIEMHLCRSHAGKEFSDCIYHQASCEGLVNEEENN